MNNQKRENQNILLCGVGGQGTILASKLIAYAAMEAGKDVRASETIGMSQRGGSVVSHVRTGTDIYSPLIPYQKADVIIAFEPAEAVRCLPYLKQGGTVVVNQKAVKPTTAALTGQDYEGKEMIHFLQSQVTNLIILDGEVICKEVGSPKVLNIALLGAAIASGALDITEEEMLDALKKNGKEKFFALNQKAFELGGRRTL
ncbi:MAG: indolepyruvate oxidoreductase subunit beta [Hespellia sp.]|nr:indolepyruvate oxidoreductase subunit beta [Hespellia sp.]